MTLDLRSIPESGRNIRPTDAVYGFEGTNTTADAARRSSGKEFLNLQNVFLRFSSDHGRTWTAAPAGNDTHYGIAIDTERPPNSSSRWSANIPIGDSGNQPTMHHLYVGWSVDSSVSAAEVQTGAMAMSDSVRAPAAASAQYMFIWRSDADGGDPTEVHIAGGGNSRNLFGTAVPLTVDGTAGQLIVSVNTFNATLVSDEIVRVV